MSALHDLAHEDADLMDFVIRAWNAGHDTAAIGDMLRLRLELLRLPMLDQSAAQAKAHNVLALYRDTKHALSARQRAEEPLHA